MGSARWVTTATAPNSTDAGYGTLGILPLGHPLTLRRADRPNPGAAQNFAMLCPR